MLENPPNSLKTQFLDLLQDEEVQEAMFKCFIQCFRDLFSSQEKTDAMHIAAQEQKMHQEIQQLQEELQGYKTQLATLKQDLHNLQEADKQKQTELGHMQEALKQAQAELEKHKIQAYELFLTLPTSLKQGLSNLFNGDDPLSFLVIGTQGRNIEMLWDYTNNALKDNTEEAKTLVEMFYALFSYYEQATPYQLDPLEVGEPYDPTKHQRHHSSTNASGNIAQVLLRGFKHARSGEVKRQSVVKL
ncbi:hypothetical protein NHP200010_04300 [Helicobacter bizzozeronii]|uniref:hypothetical protein n=1 Tax=Helicobacter bizzozeronii TaxID=56877 RepID=UPI00244D88E5|nr:hypothetical protein [Helicobacter bizzozeronii]GMB92719.1 hypothetical protein NHP200010_04300 [Helicobacter bizzozeronii]